MGKVYIPKGDEEDPWDSVLLANKLQEWREERGLSRLELAIKMGCSESTIKKIEQFGIVKEKHMTKIRKIEYGE